LFVAYVHLLVSAYGFSNVGGACSAANSLLKNTKHDIVSVHECS